MAVKKTAKKPIKKVAVTKKPAKKVAVTKKVYRTNPKDNSGKYMPFMYDDARQTGSSDKKRDQQRKALPNGKRKSASGKTYYEYRANRTDTNAKTMLGVIDNSKSDKIKIKRLKEYGQKSKAPLDKKVISILLKEYKDSGYKSLDDFLYYVINTGLQNGIISELIYYSDTIAFYKKYKAGIKAYLNATLDYTGFESPSDLFGDKWDKRDPFADDIHNQNLLVWFAFEETTNDIYNNI